MIRKIRSTTPSSPPGCSASAGKNFSIGHMILVSAAFLTPITNQDEGFFSRIDCYVRSPFYLFNLPPLARRCPMCRSYLGLIIAERTGDDVQSIYGRSMVVAPCAATKSRDFSFVRRSQTSAPSELYILKEQNFGRRQPRTP